MTFRTVFGGEYEFPVGLGYGVKIAGQHYRLAPHAERPIALYSEEVEAARSNDSPNALENTLARGYTFARSDLSGGEGLEQYPPIAIQPVKLIDESRFFDSENINVRRPGDGVVSYDLRLSEQATQFYTPPAAPIDMCASRVAAYVAEGTNVRRFINLSDSTPDDTDVIASAIKNIVCDPSDNVTVLCTNGDLYHRPRGGTGFTAVGSVTNLAATEQIETIHWVKDRLLVSTKDTTDTAKRYALDELDLVVSGTKAAPTFAATLLSDPLDTFAASVEDVIDGGIAVLVATDDGVVRSYVPQVPSAGGSPVLVNRAQTQMPQGETAFALAHNLGKVLIATREIRNAKRDVRVYDADLLDERFDFILGNRRLLHEFINADEDPGLLSRMTNDRDYIWFLIREGDGDARLWRYDVTTTGLFRHSKVSSNEAVQAMIKFRDNLMWADDTYIYRYRDGTVYHPSGWLITPNVNFRTNTELNWVTGLIEATINPGFGIQVELLGSTNPDAIYDNTHDSWRSLIRVSAQGLSGQEIAIENLIGKSLAIQLRLTSSDNDTETPTVRSFSLRALPSERDFILELPINVSDNIEAPMLQPLAIPGWGDVIHNSLLDLDGKWIEAELYDPPLRFRGIVDRVFETVNYVGLRGSSSSVCMIRLVGSRVLEDFSVATDEGLGIGTLGIASMGVEG